MPNKTYIVELTSKERKELKRLINTGKTAAYKQRHARILLLVVGTYSMPFTVILRGVYVQ